MDSYVDCWCDSVKHLKLSYMFFCVQVRCSWSTICRLRPDSEFFHTGKTWKKENSHKTTTYSWLKLIIFNRKSYENHGFLPFLTHADDTTIAIMIIMLRSHDDRLTDRLRCPDEDQASPWNKRPCGSWIWAGEQRPDTGQSCGERTGGGGAGCCHTPQREPPQRWSPCKQTHKSNIRRNDLYPMFYHIHQ